MGGKIMRVIVVPKNQLRNIIFDKKYIIISTTTDETPAVVNIPEENVIRFRFEDIDRGANGRVFNKDEALAIKKFIQGHLEDTEMIVCSCDAGMSRSPAMAAAISYWLNGSDKEIWDNHMYRPNSHVYNTLLYTLMD